jgi:hypothetical protein
MAVKLNNVLTHGLIVSGLALVCALSPTTDHRQGVKVLAEYPSGGRSICQNLPSASTFARTELFFGSLKPNGTQVSDLEFQTFLNREITPRFPDGLTLLAGFGQFKNSQGVIIKERSRLLILLYPIEQAKASSQKIEQIRKHYNALFQQESVLRTDELSCVSF